MRYDFECVRCHTVREFRRTAEQVAIFAPTHCRTPMVRLYSPPAMKFGRKDGKETGFYTLDYGKRATEDLTVPGKFQRLVREGRIHDPFDDVAPKPRDPQLVEETFGAPTGDELKAHKREVTGNHTEI